LTAVLADVLRVKFRLGLFDDPYVKDPKAADKIVT
jgi:beta-glucosidase